MTLEQMLEQFKGKAPPWGPKLSPTATEELKKALESFRLIIYQEGLTDGYSQGYMAAEKAMYQDWE